MADSPRDPDSSSDTGENTSVGPDREPTTAAPRWVRVFGIIALVVVLLFVILVLTRGPGGHTPSRHFGGQAPPSSVIEDGGRGGHAPLAGGH